MYIMSPPKIQLITIQRKLFMNRIKIKELIQQGRAKGAEQRFFSFQYGLNPEDFLAEYPRNEYDQCSSKHMYMIFIDVLSLLSSNSTNERFKNSTNLENSKIIREYLKQSIPHKIVDISDYHNNDKIPEYLDSWKSDAEVLQFLWDGLRSLKSIVNDDLAIRVAWGACSYMNS